MLLQPAPGLINTEQAPQFNRFSNHDKSQALRDDQRTSDMLLRARAVMRIESERAD
jgi:hypothetical protein